MNIIIDDTLIFYDEDNSSISPSEELNSREPRSARWFVEMGNKIIKGIESFGYAALEKTIQDEPELNEMDAYLIQVGPVFEPRPFSLQHLTQRIPYSNPKKLAHRLSTAEERGWLEGMAGQQYFVSTRGRVLRDRLLEQAEEGYAAIEALPSGELMRLDSLLSKVVEHALRAELPEDKFGVEWSRRFDFDSNTSLMSKVRRRLVDLFAFRDDAHISAWKAHEPEGYIWEAFTYVWNDESNTPKDLAKRLAYRGYSEDAYKHALDELVLRGWLTTIGGIYKATPAGKALRDAVEEQTDKYFDGPWESLTAEEFEEVKDLMKLLEEKVQLEPAIN